MKEKVRAEPYARGSGCDKTEPRNRDEDAEIRLWFVIIIKR